MLPIPTKGLPGAKCNIRVLAEGRPNKVPVVAWDEAAAAVLGAGNDSHAAVEGFVRRKNFPRSDGSERWETILTVERVAVDG